MSIIRCDSQKFDHRIYVNIAEDWSQHFGKSQLTWFLLTSRHVTQFRVSRRFKRKDSNHQNLNWVSKWFMFSHTEWSTLFLPARGALKHREGAQPHRENGACRVFSCFIQLTHFPCHGWRLIKISSLWLTISVMTLLPFCLVTWSFLLIQWTRVSPPPSGPGGLLRQGCGLDVTRGPTGNRGSLPPVTKRSKQSKAHACYDSACDLHALCLLGIANGQPRTNAQ